MSSEYPDDKTSVPFHHVATDSKLHVKEEMLIKVYGRRYYMVFLFSFLSLLCGMLFTEYTSMANVNMCYYDISMNALNWTAYMFYLGYVIFVLPVSFLLNYVGLRLTIIAGALCNTTACALQFLGLNPGAFSYILFSQVFASAASLLVFAVPPFLAATWFPSNELSRACAAGVVGNQLGVAAGYLLSPLMISNDCSDKAKIQDGKFKVTTTLTSVNLIWLLLIILTFQNKPKLPPTLIKAKKVSLREFISGTLGMLKSLQFWLLIIICGILVGSYYSITTILNPLVLFYFPNKEKEIGWMGNLFIVSGLAGSMIAGTILDYTHRFKETTLGISIASLITCVLFCSLLSLQILWVTFLTIIIFGFFLTSFTPVGIEYGIELTYPEPEVISASLLTSSPMILGLIMTEIFSRLLTGMGPALCTAAIAIFLLISILMTSFLTKNYKRSKRAIAISQPSAASEEVVNQCKL